MCAIDQSFGTLAYKERGGMGVVEGFGEGTKDWSGVHRGGHLKGSFIGGDGRFPVQGRGRVYQRSILDKRSSLSCLHSQ